jgi:hypothetical protein
MHLYWILYLSSRVLRVKRQVKIWMSANGMIYSVDAGYRKESVVWTNDTFFFDSSSRMQGWYSEVQNNRLLSYSSPWVSNLQPANWMRLARNFYAAHIHIGKLNIIIIHHSVVCLTTSTLPLSKRVIHKVWSNAYSFNFQYSFVSPRSSSSCLRLLPRLSVTSILGSTFPSIMCLRRQFLH